MDPKLAKQVDDLYRNCKQMPLLCVLSLVVPIVLPFVVPLCIVYAAQRRALLKRLDDVEQPATNANVGADEMLAEKVAYLREKDIYFYGPIIIAAVVVPIALLLLMY